MIRSKVRAALTSVAIPLVSLLGTQATVAAEPEDMIKYRQAVMQSIGGHMGATAAILFGKVENTDDLGYHVEALAAALGSAGGLFPPDSDFGETDALAEIWENPDAFSAKVQDASQAAAALAEAVRSGSGDAVDRFKALGGTCKACHDDFREKRN